MKTYEELEVWQYAMALVVDVYRLTSNFPSDERFALSSQIRRAAVSIPSNIAEGFGRASNKDFAHFLAQARGSLCEVATQLEIASRLDYIVSAEIPRDKIESISKMLRSFVNHLQQQG